MFQGLVTEIRESVAGFPAPFLVPGLTELVLELQEREGEGSDHAARATQASQRAYDSSKIANQHTYDHDDPRQIQLRGNTEHKDAHAQGAKHHQSAALAHSVAMLKWENNHNNTSDPKLKAKSLEQAKLHKKQAETHRRFEAAHAKELATGGKGPRKQIWGHVFGRHDTMD